MAKQTLQLWDGQLAADASFTLLTAVCSCRLLIFLTRLGFECSIRIIAECDPILSCAQLHAETGACVLWYKLTADPKLRLAAMGLCCGISSMQVY